MNENEEKRSAHTAETQPEVNGEQNQNGRVFTQEELNHIIKERLERERAKAAEPSPEMRQRLADLDARESRVFCREYLVENGMPSELLDIIDTSNVDTFKEKAEKAYALMNDRARYDGFQGIPMYSGESRIGDLAAMGFANTRHEPKGKFWE